MKLVIAIGFGAWQTRVLDGERAMFWLGSYYYVQEKQFDDMWKRLAEQEKKK